MIMLLQQILPPAAVKLHEFPIFFSEKAKILQKGIYPLYNASAIPR